MKKHLYPLVACILFVGCSSMPVAQSPEPTGTETVPPTPTWTSTSEPTNTMTPTATATLVPLSDIDWNAIAYQGGDVPSNFGIIDEEIIGINLDLGTVPAPGHQAGINLLVPGTEDRIRAVLFVYESEETAQETYQIISVGTEPSTLFGEQAFTSTTIINDEMFGMILWSQLSFLRCQAVVSMIMATFDYSEQTWSDPSILTGYAEKLDARLSEVACR